MLKKMSSLWTSSAHAQPDANLPSIFSLLASSGLRGALRPAVSHVTLYLAEQVPNVISHKIYFYSDELFALIDFLLSRHFLRNFAALFAEHFYGLKRTSSNGGKIGKTLAIQVLLPYLKLKLDRIYQQKITEEQEANSYRFLAVLQPLVNFSFIGLDLIFNLLYVSGKSRYFSLLNWLEGSEIIHVTSEDQDASEEMIKSWPFLLRMGHQLLASGMEVGAFALQFIDYWYSQEAAGGNSSHNIIMETASLQAPKASLSLINKCPLCRTSNIQTPTVLIICGYVFCYRCILEQVQKQKTCPMTGLPAHSGQLIRLF